MTLAEIISSLEDQARDKDALTPADEPDSIFAHDAEALRAAAERLRDPPVIYDGTIHTVEWVRVTAGSPRIYQHVLVYIPILADQKMQAVHEGWLGADDAWHSATAPAFQELVTHWAPMPAPPRKEIESYD